MILLFDSSSMTAKLHIVQGGQTNTYEWEAGRTLAKNMLQFLEDKISSHGGSWDDLEGIGILRGPGSYTGLRIGITVLNTLAESLRIPIVGATGDEWVDICLERLSQGETDKVVLPEYGADAHITKPRK
jgi:tRNA threonylcarbamoyladenosine biosynthesis protein TsaB